ncbi:MAG: hypothetical protein MH132_01285 [Hydrotalea sp.]|nr:hypothetical protein [Hydrotalea sp.]
MNLFLYLDMRNTTFKYTVTGVLFGLLFPLFAWATELILLDLPFSLETFLLIHRSNKLILIIETAPIVLGFVFYFLGKKQQQLKRFNNELNVQVADKDDIIKDNLAKIRNIKQTQSHVVRRPLSNIMGLISLLNMTQLSETQKEILEQLSESSKELDDVIRDIVQQSKEN